MEVGSCQNPDVKASRVGATVTVGAIQNQLGPWGSGGLVSWSSRGDTGAITGISYTGSKKGRDTLASVLSLLASLPLAPIS